MKSQIVDIFAKFPSLAFPKDRTSLMVTEVAEKLRVTDQHIIDLIAEGSIRAVNVSGNLKSKRAAYRIPVEAYEDFLRARFVS